jgi:hypothetical protein
MFRRTILFVSLVILWASCNKENRQKAGVSDEAAKEVENIVKVVAKAVLFLTKPKLAN